MGSLINSSNILNSLTGSGMRAKNFSKLASGNQYEFSGGGVALIKSTSFLVIKLDDAVNVDPEMFKDFSRGYAYGNKYTSGTAGQISRLRGTRNGTHFITGDVAINNTVISPHLATSLDVDYVSSGSSAEKQYDVVKYEYYTIPFDEYIKVQSSVNYTSIMIYES